MSRFLSFYKKLTKRDQKGNRFWERDLFGRDQPASLSIIGSLCRQMAFMLNAGVTLKSVMTVLADDKNIKVRANLQRVLERIMGGESLSQSLEKTGYFPVFMCNMCRIGEMSDDLPKVMTLLADYYEESARYRDDIKSALLYPAVVAVMMLTMILSAVLFVLPNYALMFEVSDVPLPMLTQVLLSISDVILNQWWLVMPIAVFTVMVPIIIIRSSKGRPLFESGILKLSPYRHMINLHIVQAMALLQQSGRSLADSVLAVSTIIPNQQVAKDLRQVYSGLQEGESFWTLLANMPYLDLTIISMARVGEETGNMAQVFEHAHAYSRHQFKLMSRRLNKVLEPAITMVLGLILGIVMLSIILPTFAMMEVVGY